MPDKGAWLTSDQGCWPAVSTQAAGTQRRGGDGGAAQGGSGGATDSQGGFRGRVADPSPHGSGAPMSGPVQRSADVWRRAGDEPPAPRCSRVARSGRGARLPDPAAL
ncbi:unnamed protein product [Colias eurytheme]|nr:unnamed protein product [Colias eurytheme]